MTRGRAVDVVYAETSRCRREQRDVSSRRWTEPKVEDRVLEPERAASISSAITELRAPERDAVVSAFYRDQTRSEAALVLGVSAGNVKSHIRTSRIRLRAALGNPFWPLDDHAS